MGFSKETSEKIKNLFDDIKWKYVHTEYEDRCLFKAGMDLEGDRKLSKVTILINVQAEDVSIISTCTIKSDEKNKQRIAEYICRANYGLKDGNFEFDYDEGKIRYKSYIFFGERSFEEKEIVRALIVLGEMWNLYGDGFVDLLGGNRTPKDIIEEIENVIIE